MSTLEQSLCYLRLKDFLSRLNDYLANLSGHSGEETSSVGCRSSLFQVVLRWCSLCCSARMYAFDPKDFQEAVVENVDFCKLIGTWIGEGVRLVAVVGF